MHAVVVRVTINDEDASHRELQEKVVPAISEARGSSPAIGHARTTPGCRCSSSSLRTPPGSWPTGWLRPFRTR